MIQAAKSLRFNGEQRLCGSISIHDSETDSPFLTLHRRDGAGFRREILSGPEAILTLPEAGVTIPLAELYSDVS